MTHILLSEGDIIKEGDEYWSCGGKCWMLASNTGAKIRGLFNDPIIYRRALPDKVRLEGFRNFLYELLREKTQGQNRMRDTLEQHAKSICAHLGIEIEEKEPWEKDYDQFKKDIEKLTAENHEGLSYDSLLAKYMWQACERRKGDSK